MKRILASLIVLTLLLIACDQSSAERNAAPSASASSSTSATASARVSGSAAASAGASAKQIELQVVVPENGAKAGINGVGWTVDVIAKGAGPALDKVKPSIRGGGLSGRHPNFPGLVILLKSSSAGGQAGNPNMNLAGLFQIIGLPNTLGPNAGISSVGTNASASPAPTGGSGASGASGTSGASGASSPAGTATTRSISSTDNQTAEATWFVDQTVWGSDVDVELTAFVVDGDAPDMVSDRSALKIVSNEVTVRFHINGGTANGSAKPSASGAPAASPSASPSGSARPSASASSTP